MVDHVTVVSRILFSILANLNQLQLVSLSPSFFHSFGSVLWQEFFYLFAFFDFHFPVSRILLSILANIAVVWMVLILHQISYSSSPQSTLLGTVPSSPTAIGIIIALMYHNFWQELVYLFAFFYFCSVVSRILLGILADHSKPVVWMVSASPPISITSSFFTKPLGTVPRTQTTISITVTNIMY